MNKCAGALVAAFFLLVANARQATAETLGELAAWMEGNLPAVMCQSGGYARRCYAVSALECTRAVTQSARHCVDLAQEHPNFDIDVPLDREQSTELAGFFIACTGKRYESSMHGRERDTASCVEQRGRPATW